jgi:hypothetical protein
MTTWLWHPKASSGRWHHSLTPKHLQGCGRLRGGHVLSCLQNSPTRTQNALIGSSDASAADDEADAELSERVRPRVIVCVAAGWPSFMASAAAAPVSSAPLWSGCGCSSASPPRRLRSRCAAKADPPTLPVDNHGPSRNRSAGSSVRLALTVNMQVTAPPKPIAEMRSTELTVRPAKERPRVTPEMKMTRPVSVQQSGKQAQHVDHNEVT